MPRGSPITGVRVLLGQAKYESDTSVSKQPDNGFSFFWGPGNTVLLLGKSVFSKQPQYFSTETSCYQFIRNSLRQSNAKKCSIFLFFKITFIVHFQAVCKIISAQGLLVTALELSILSHELLQRIKFAKLSNNWIFKCLSFEHIKKFNFMFP